MLVPEIANLTIPRYPKKTMTNTRARNSKKRLRRVFLTLFVAGFALAISAAPVLAQESANGGGFNPQEWLRNALQWIDNLGAVGAIAFILLYIIATVAFLPGSILTLGAGVVFGVVLGSFYVFIGATLGATAAFLVGRYVARGWVAKKIEGNKKFRAIDEAVGREGLKIVLLTRLSPIFPFNLLNYAYGITGVSLKDYVIGSVGMIPGTIMYVYIGSLAGSLATIGTEAQPANPTVQWAIRIIGFIATVAVTLYVTKVARKALEEEVLDPEDNQTKPVNPN
ncbi:TVP38/TMEM64 family protein [Coleofasciculus chthonoplastes]|uniref:TVP38/TMEM64 family protein n=1 Tax=Coleofasciculus chthonoplastes TaxID=64178 RepID=UPI0040629C10